MKYKICKKCKLVTEREECWVCGRKTTELENDGI